MKKQSNSLNQMAYCYMQSLPVLFRRKKGKPIVIVGTPITDEQLRETLDLLTNKN